MTREYWSKENAIRMGIFFSRGKIDIAIKDLKRVKGKVAQFGEEIEGSEIYELENSKGETVRIGVSPYRGNKWNLWLITEEGLTLRT